MSRKETTMTIPAWQHWFKQPAFDTALDSNISVNN